MHMTHIPIHIDSFQSGDDITRKTKYEDLKAQILAAGRYSCFEASANQYAAALFMRLDRDPELEITNAGSTWIKVQRKV